jgi:hypothetical protein
MNKDMFILFHLEFDHVIMIYMYIVDLYIQKKCTCTCIIYVSELTGLKKKAILFFSFKYTTYINEGKDKKTTLYFNILNIQQVYVDIV